MTLQSNSTSSRDYENNFSYFHYKPQVHLLHERPINSALKLPWCTDWSEYRFLQCRIIWLPGSDIRVYHGTKLGDGFAPSNTNLSYKYLSRVDTRSYKPIDGVKTSRK